MITSYRNMRRLVCLAGLLALLCCGTAVAAEPARKPVPPAPTAPAADAAEALQPTAVSAPLEVFNRTVTVFRAPFFGVAPVDRAVRAKQEILRVLGKGGPGKVSVESSPHGRVIMLDGELVFTLFSKDVDPLGGETLDQATEKTVKELAHVVAETREARNVSTMFRAGGKASLATVVLLLLVWVLHRMRGWVAARILPLAQEKSSRLRVDGEVLFNGEFVLKFVTWLFAIFYWFATLLLVYEWLVYSMGLFPYTRPWGERLMQYLLTVAGNIASGMLTAIPKLLIAFLIFLIANSIVKLLNSFFDRVKTGDIELAWLDEDTVRPTRRLVAGAVWVFALAMAYPYLPGSETQAFKGLSVLLGLMISLGASSLVGQAASGLILMYTRTMRAGEYVSISDKEGTVVELGLFTTRLRNGMGEELTMPNSLVLGTVTKNYSRMVHGTGFILSTTVTIGYDTPWRQVHAMLLEAARRTSGVLADPPPRVFQQALSDYYPEYRLVCQAIPSTPLPRAEVLTALHANIQDVFNEYGVQIMSPHYMGDPAEAKVVPKEGWYAAPAIPPAGGEQG
jgi:small-conductance mechanosensitive channel